MKIDRKQVITFSDYQLTPFNERNCDLKKRLSDD
jgi:hypothetical protein